MRDRFEGRQGREDSQGRVWLVNRAQKDWGVLGKSELPDAGLFYLNPFTFQMATSILVREML